MSFSKREYERLHKEQDEEGKGGMRVNSKKLSHLCQEQDCPKKHVVGVMMPSGRTIKLCRAHFDIAFKRVGTP